MYQKADELFVYHIGDEIKVNGMDFYVIADSPASQDYVVALKAEPLTVAEVNLYGGVGAENKFLNNELKESSEYEVRLITISELEKMGYQKVGEGEYDLNYLLTDSVPQWVYFGYYWTSSVRKTSSGQGQIWCVKPDGSLEPNDMNYSTCGIRPVISVLKSAIDG